MRQVPQAILGSDRDHLPRTKVPLRTWLMVMVQMCSAKNGISAREIERMYGVTPETSWFMLQRLRKAMKREPLAEMVTGTVVADETFIGGVPKNRTARARRRTDQKPARATPECPSTRRRSSLSEPGDR